MKTKNGNRKRILLIILLFGVISAVSAASCPFAVTSYRSTENLSLSRIWIANSTAFRGLVYAPKLFYATSITNGNAMQSHGNIHRDDWKKENELGTVPVSGSEAIVFALFSILYVLFAIYRRIRNNNLEQDIGYK